MPVCPFCQTDNPMPSLPCGGCGKLMKDHPSFSSGQGYSVRPGDAPELELSSRHAPKASVKAPSLPPPPPKKPAAARSPAPSARVPPKPVALPGVGGAVFDEDDIFSPGGGGGGEAIELEMPIGGPGPSSGMSSGTGTGTGAGQSAVSVKLPVSSPRGVLVRVNDAPDDDSEARALADYGDSPSSFWQAPLYAYRVKTRQSELRRQLHERQTDLLRAERSEEQAKIAFAERARPIAERLEAYAQTLDPIGKTERVMMDRGGALSAEMEAHKGRLAVIDDRVHGLEVELEQAKAEEREIEGKLAEAEGIRQRADAKLKRAEIEIRNATSVAEAGGVKVGPARRAGSPS